MTKTHQPPLFEMPFEECELMTSARRSAHKFSSTDLSLVIEGQLGTGRRTLARSVVAARSATDTRELYAGDGIPEQLRRAPGLGMGERLTLIVFELHELNDEGSRWLLHQIFERQVCLVATCEVGAVPTVFKTAVTSIHLTPLSERTEVVSWANYFLDMANTKYSSRCRLSREARERIALHRWPGNLYELKSSIERAVMLSREHELGSRDLQLSDTCVADSQVTPLKQAVEDFKRKYVLEVLERLGGNRTRAARVLGVDARTIFRLLEREKLR